MKWFPVLCLMLIMSCDEPRRNYRDATIQLPQLPQLSQAPNQGDLSEFTSKGIVHLNPKVKIDIERQEIEVTEVIGSSKEFCGIALNNGDVLRYQLISNYELEVYMRDETLKMKRVHKTENGIYGDWQETKYTARDSERIVTFFIRENEVMYVDIYCEQKSGLEEF